MVSYTHLPTIALCFFVLMFMRRWWLCVDRMGYTKEVCRRAPSLVQRDILAATFALMPFALAAADWFSITLPGQAAPIPSMLAVIMSLGCVGGVIFILKNTGDRFAGNWAGTRESALRTVAALRIIDAAELAYALQYIQERETANAGRVIDAETLREVRK
jgi:hypothetical protein